MEGYQKSKKEKTSKSESLLGQLINCSSIQNKELPSSSVSPTSQLENESWNKIETNINTPTDQNLARSSEQTEEPFHSSLSAFHSPLSIFHSGPFQFLGRSENTPAVQHYQIHTEKSSRKSSETAESISMNSTSRGVVDLMDALKNDSETSDDSLVHDDSPIHTVDIQQTGQNDTEKKETLGFWLDLNSKKDKEKDGSKDSSTLPVRSSQMNEKMNKAPPIPLLNFSKLNLPVQETEGQDSHQQSQLELHQTPPDPPSFQKVPSNLQMKHSNSPHTPPKKFSKVLSYGHSESADLANTENQAQEMEIVGSPTNVLIQRFRRQSLDESHDLSSVQQPNGSGKGAKIKQEKVPQATKGSKVIDTPKMQPSASPYSKLNKGMRRPSSSHANKNTNPQTRPRTTARTSQQSGSRTGMRSSPRTSPRSSPRTSPRSSPRISPRSSPKTSSHTKNDKYHSPKTGRKGSEVQPCSVGTQKKKNVTTSNIPRKLSSNQSTSISDTSDGRPPFSPRSANEKQDASKRRSLRGIADKTQRKFLNSSTGFAPTPGRQEGSPRGNAEKTERKSALAAHQKRSTGKESTSKQERTSFSRSVSPKKRSPQSSRTKGSPRFKERAQSARVWRPTSPTKSYIRKMKSCNSHSPDTPRAPRVGKSPPKRSLTSRKNTESSRNGPTHSSASQNQRRSLGTSREVDQTTATSPSHEMSKGTRRYSESTKRSSRLSAASRRKSEITQSSQPRPQTARRRTETEGSKGEMNRFSQSRYNGRVSKQKEQQGSAGPNKQSISTRSRSPVLAHSRDASEFRMSYLEGCEDNSTSPRFDQGSQHKSSMSSIDDRALIHQNSEGSLYEPSPPRRLQKHRSTEELLVAKIAEKRQEKQKQLSRWRQYYEFSKTSAQKLKSKAQKKEETKLITGRMFHGYKLGRVLRTGGVGVVRSCSKKGSLNLAMKIVNYKTNDDLKAMEAEAQLLKEISKGNHPNVISYEESMDIIEQNLYIIITERMDIDLLDYANSSLCPKPDNRFLDRNSIFLDCFESVLSALHHMHSSGYVHFDVKPENILLSLDLIGESKKVTATKVADFGHCKYLGSSKKAQGVTGTVGYFAPEMVTTPTYSGPMADMWSLGCSAVQVAIGQDAYSTGCKEPSMQLIETYRRVKNVFKEPSSQMYEEMQTIVEAFLPEIVDILLSQIVPAHTKECPALEHLIHSTVTLNPITRADAESLRAELKQLRKR